ncbi:uncharacterized protein DSM5745_04794 [Aspergillus mulundensis]|uniref:Uncharacterized protein n=1 Tax=Aspergillus mulundensis TaxID=1810919 RepID=A0A3D8S4L3_9EURO|nr:Uncharacterized protein DSM5745_04794 [Aspergillus mulundensis]RDW81237.1 Uncharacterized protein DSM5745_04794 [Aspergillus mulundensis]
MPSIKPVLPPLKTPSNITFPSELHTDSSAGSGKNEDSSSTPITPPAAYTEFLKAFTPIFSSPTSAEGIDFTKFKFDRHNVHSARSQPSSAVSGSFNFNESARSATASLPPLNPLAPPCPRRELSNLRRLRIPPALRYSPTSAEPLRSAGPRSAGPRSATIARTPYSPIDWRLRYLDSPRSANPRSSNHKMSVRHVITHTITYKTTELDAPPKGKRRKHSHDNKESK